MTSQVDRYDWADFMRGLLMILVVVYHSQSYYYTGYKWSWVFEPVFLSGFFFVSGFLFCRDIKNVDLKTKAKQVLRGIVFPYFCFMFIIALPKILLGHADLRQLLIDIFLMRASWFVVAVGGMQLIFAMILEIRPTIRALMIGTLFMFAFGYALVVMYRNPPIWLLNNPWLHSVELPNRLPLCVNLTMVQSPFFLLGILYRQHEVELGRFMTKKMFGCSLFLYGVCWCWIDHYYIGSDLTVVTDSYNNIGLIFMYGMIGIWAMLCLSYWVQRWRLMNYIGKNSILFYFLNGGALTITALLLRRIKNLDSASLYAQIACVVTAVGLLFLFTWVINKYFPILTGEKNTVNKWSERFGLKIRW